MSDDIDRALQAHLGGTLAGVANRVGDILGDILKEWQPKQASAAFPFRRMIPEMAPKLIEKLKSLDYWDTFSETGFSAAYKARYSVIWLNSLNQLLNKHDEGNAKGRRFGLAEIDDPKVTGGGASFVTQPELDYKDIRLAHNPQEPHLGEFAKMDNRTFRVFMAGLVIDLMRLASEAANDAQFWGDLVGFLQSKTE